MVTTTYQYPQYLYAFRNGEAEQLANGSWKPSHEGWELVAACREETNGKGHTIQAANGQFLVFASLIQLPKGTQRVNEGTEVIVTREPVDVSELLQPGYIDSAKITGLAVAKGVCQKFDYGRLHCRLWI